MILLLALCLSQPAHSGLWRTVCEALIKPDPYEFEDWDDRDLERAIARLKIKEEWKTINEGEKQTLSLMRSTMRFRISGHQDYAP